MITLSIHEKTIGRLTANLLNQSIPAFHAKTRQFGNVLTERVAETVHNLAQKTLTGEVGGDVRYQHDYYNHDLRQVVPRFTQKHYQTGRLHKNTLIEKISNKEYNIGTRNSVNYGDYIVGLDRIEVGRSHLERGLELTAPDVDAIALNTAQEVF